MHQHHMDAHQVQQHDVLDHSLFQFFVNHGISAIFHHDDLAVVFLDVRKRLDQDIGTCFRGNHER